MDQTKGKLLVLAVVFLAVFASLLTPKHAFGQVQQKVLYSFCSASNCTDGASPHGILTFDGQGNLYGTTQHGGANCSSCGAVFELTPSADGTWTETVIYSFSGPDGANPMAGVTFDRSGNLYGTTENGGAKGLGSVYELSPPGNSGGAWTETVLWSFSASGGGPLSRLNIDSSGNLYGTTQGGGAYNGGMVFQLAPPESGGQWSMNTLYSFGQDINNGWDLVAGVTFDAQGNLYGTTLQGGAKEGFGLGVIYKLSPNAGLPWTETVLTRFNKGSGGNPYSAINFDPLGNMYGTTLYYGGAYGSVFRLTPQGKFATIGFGGAPGPASPLAGVFIKGNQIYGTTQGGGAQNEGALYQVQGSKETVLYSFCSLANCADGFYPEAGLVSRNGKLYGTTAAGGTGAQGGGVVYEISLPNAKPAAKALTTKSPPKKGAL